MTSSLLPSPSDEVDHLKGQVAALEQATMLALTTFVGLWPAGRAALIITLQDGLRRIDASIIDPGNRMENPAFSAGFEDTLARIHRQLGEYLPNERD